jgi:mannose-6-phosphate isomerase-like protein (cupin superfamily)
MRPMATREHAVERTRAEGPPRPDAFRAGPRLPVYRAGDRRGSRSTPTRLPKIAHPPLTVVDLGAETLTLNVGDPSRVLARVNESGLRFSVFRGGGAWHVHPASDECFLVLRGALLLDLKDGRTIRVGRHQLVTVPAGLVHRPRADVRTVTLCFKLLIAPTRFLEDDAPRRHRAPTSRPS